MKYFHAQLPFLISSVFYWFSRFDQESIKLCAMNQVTLGEINSRRENVKKVIFVHFFYPDLVG